MRHFTNHSEENYLKAIFKLSSKKKKVNNVALSKELDLNPASVLEMIRKMGAKKFIELLPDKTITLTDKGKKAALITIRKHRLWEVFLVNKLKYQWDEVHELAEQLEHIESEDLIDRLEAFLDYPSTDPHGDPIPDKKGRVKPPISFPLSTAQLHQTYLLTNLADTTDSFLNYLNKLNIEIGSLIKLIDINEYDQSVVIVVNKKQLHLSQKAAQNMHVYYEKE